MTKTMDVGQAVEICNDSQIMLLEYSGKAREKSLLRCARCGREWYMPVGHIRIGRGCSACKSPLPNTEAETALPEVPETIQVKDFDGYEHKVCCSVCGEEWWSPLSLVRKHGCTNCSLSSWMEKQQHFLRQHPDICRQEAEEWDRIQAGSL